MRNGNKTKTVDAEIFEDSHTPEQDAWYRDCRFARYGMEDGLFAKDYGYILAIYNEKVVGKGKNPAHLRRRMAKKLGVDGLRIVLLNTELGII